MPREHLEVMGQVGALGGESLLVSAQPVYQLQLARSCRVGFVPLLLQRHLARPT